MTEQKNSSEKTQKTDKSEKPASAPKKPSIEPKSARGASTTARRKTAKEADAALQAKIEKAHAGAMPERREPAVAGESAGLPPMQTVRAMPQINRKKDETTSDEKAAAPAKKTENSKKATSKKPSAPVKMPERDATGRFLPSQKKAKKPQAKAQAQHPQIEEAKKLAEKPAEQPESKPAQNPVQKSEPKPVQKAPKQAETKTEKQPGHKTQETKTAKKPEGPVTSAAPAAPVTPVKPVHSLLMDEAPSGVMTDMMADDRTAPGEVRGKPADETAEAPSSPLLKPSVNQSPNGSRITDVDGEDDDEDYDGIPDPTVSVSESADDDELEDDEDDEPDDEQSSADAPVKKPVSVIRPAAEDPEPVELDSQGRPYHATEVLSGRRTPVRVKPPVEEPADPSRTVDLETERIDAEHTARQALLRLHARTQPTRAELASMLVSKKIEQMERGNPAFEKDPSQEGKLNSVPDQNEDARSKSWNSLWGNSPPINLILSSSMFELPTLNSLDAIDRQQVHYATIQLNGPRFTIDTADYFNLVIHRALHEAGLTVEMLCQELRLDMSAVEDMLQSKVFCPDELALITFHLRLDTAFMMEAHAALTLPSCSKPSTVVAEPADTLKECVVKHGYKTLNHFSEVHGFDPIAMNTISLHRRCTDSTGMKLAQALNVSLEEIRTVLVASDFDPVPKSLKLLMTKRNYTTYKEFAVAAGLTEHHIMKIAKTRTCTTTCAVKLCKALGITEDELAASILIAEPRHKHGSKLETPSKEAMEEVTSTKARRKKDESDTEEECGTSTVSLKRPRRSSK